jgi:phosphoribosylformimino-5-aminoimidazole carboxamide ribotide isomerase
VATPTTSTFEIYPAIDLRAGRVVRLRQGDFTREQVYDDDPAAVAARFSEAGAAWIHVVDLDGARDGRRRQEPSVAAIVAAVQAVASADRRPRLQVAGGIRTAETVADLLASGADRVVLGTAALRDPRVVAAAIDRHGADRIAVALDVRDDVAIGDGWAPGAAGLPVERAIETLSNAGVRTFTVTAIDRDGILGGPDLGLLVRALDLADGDVIASGGIASLDDLLEVRRIGCRGAIVGRAIYDGRIDLAEAIRTVQPAGSA